MKFYPIKPIYDNYYGADKRRREKASERNEVAREVVDFINADLFRMKDGCRDYSADTIAKYINRSVSDVRDILNELDGGHNGITVCIGNGRAQLEGKDDCR